MLLPVAALLRRADAAEVIGAALAAKARGEGFRTIAACVGRPIETVRGWLRRFAGRLEPVRSVFTNLLRVLDPDPVMPEPQPTAWADVVAAIRAVAGAAAARFTLGTVTWPLVAVTISSGRLLAPGWPEKTINTS